MTLVSRPPEYARITRARAIEVPRPSESAGCSESDVRAKLARRGDLDRDRYLQRVHRHCQRHFDCCYREKSMKKWCSTHCRSDPTSAVASSRVASCTAWPG